MMDKQTMIATADALTAEADRLEALGQLTRAAYAHRQASALWARAGSYVMPNACLAEAERCERSRAFRAWYATLPGATP